MLPAALYFSYYPLIHFGSDESMNFEISLPLIWLVLFDVLSFGMMIKNKSLFRKFGRKWLWLLFPVYLTISLCWSANLTRGILTAGIMWLIYFAGFAMYSLRDLFKREECKEKFWKWFFGATLFVCGWCLIQCILDLAGVGREYTLMCAGCTYQMFGFPHPNGFAIEPQFMGNLLIAPTIISGWLMLRSWPRPAGPSSRAAGANSRAAALRDAISSKHYAILFFVFTSALFLTFSRGAIYAFVVGMVFTTVVCSPKHLTRGALKAVRSSLWSRVKCFRALIAVWAIIAFSFVFVLNIQGVMAQVSKTNDTYMTGISKVLNHLSLGIIDINDRGELPVENSVDNSEDDLAEEAVFDGYVAESTDTRLRLTDEAISIWRKDFKTMMFGVGLGGAGQALYDDGYSVSAKEIIQNEYVSLLLEAGLIGVVLLILTLVLIIKHLIRTQNNLMVLALLVGYGVSLCFFSGFANGLHIYLLPIAFSVIKK